MRRAPEINKNGYQLQFLCKCSTEAQSRIPVAEHLGLIWHYLVISKVSNLSCLALRHTEFNTILTGLLISVNKY